MTKTNKMICAPIEVSYQPGHPSSLTILRCAPSGQLRFLHADSENAGQAKTLVRLCADAQADLRLHRTHVILFVLPCSSKYLTSPM